MISEIMYKNMNAIQMENEKICVIVIPDLGGKIISFYNKKKEFEVIYQGDEEILKEPMDNTEYRESSICGFDEAFPTVEECTVKLNGKYVKYPELGEVWKRKMAYGYDEDTLTMWFDSKILPYRYEKVISIDNKGINMSYKIKNTGEFDFPCIWTSNFLVKCSDNMEVKFPGDVCEIINVKESSILGEKEKIHAFPITMSEKGKSVRLDKVNLENKEYDERFYVIEKVKKGRAHIYYNDSSIKYKLKYSKEDLPYVGLSIKGADKKRDYIYSLILSNGFYDNVNKAIEEGKNYNLKKNQVLEFEVYITLK